MMRTTDSVTQTIVVLIEGNHIVLYNYLFLFSNLSLFSPNLSDNFTNVSVFYDHSYLQIASRAVFFVHLVRVPVRHAGTLFVRLFQRILCKTVDRNGTGASKHGIVF